MNCEDRKILAGRLFILAACAVMGWYRWQHREMRQASETKAGSAGYFALP